MRSSLSHVYRCGNYSGVCRCRAIVFIERFDSVAGERDLDGDERIVAERVHGLHVAGDAGIGLAVGSEFVTSSD